MTEFLPFAQDWVHPDALVALSSIERSTSASLRTLSALLDGYEYREQLLDEQYEPIRAITTKLVIASVPRPKQQTSLDVALVRLVRGEAMKRTIVLPSAAQLRLAFATNPQRLRTQIAILSMNIAGSTATS